MCPAKIVSAIVTACDWDADSDAALTLTNGRPRRVVFIK